MSNKRLSDLEWVAEYSLSTPVEVFKKAITTLENIKDLYQGKIRFLLTVNNREELEYWANLLPDIQNFDKDKIRFNIHCRNGFLNNLPVLKNGWGYSGNIYSLADIKLLIDSKTKIDFFNYRLTESTAEDLIKVPSLLREYKIPTSFITFKMNPTATFSNELKSKIKSFLVKEIADFYYYDSKRGAVYNRAQYGAFKSIRPITKYRLKFSVNNFSAIIQDENGLIRESMYLEEKVDRISVDSFVNLINKFIEEFKVELTPFGIYLDSHCSECEYEQFCKFNASPNLLKIDKFECENTKLSIFIQELLESDEPTQEKIAYFAKKENQIQA